MISAALLAPVSPIDSGNRQQAHFGQDAETPLTDVSISGAISSDSWAWVELNYRPHAYQARKLEAKVGQDVRISL